MLSFRKHEVLSPVQAIRSGHDNNTRRSPSHSQAEFILTVCQSLGRLPTDGTCDNLTIPDIMPEKLCMESRGIRQGRLVVEIVQVSPSLLRCVWDKLLRSRLIKQARGAARNISNIIPYASRGGVGKTVMRRT